MIKSTTSVIQQKKGKKCKYTIKNQEHFVFIHNIVKETSRHDNFRHLLLYLKFNR